MSIIETTVLSFNSDKSLEAKIRLLQSRIEVLEAARKDHFSHNLADSVSSIIGLREVVTSKQPFLKFVWILLVTFGFLATAFFMYATIEEYLDNPTLTKVKLHLHSQYGYPPIVICTRSWFDANKAYELGLTTDGLKYSLGYADPRLGSLLEPTNVSQARTNFHEVFNRSGFESLTNFYKHISVTLDGQESKEAFFNSTSVSYFVEEGLENVSLVFGPSGGTCHLFQFEPLDGKSGSLIQPMTIRIKYTYQGEMTNKELWMIYFNKSAAARYGWPLMVPTGGNVYLRIQGEVFKSLNTRRHPCEERSGEDHSSANCMSDCQNQFYRELLGCQFFFLAVGNKPSPPDRFCNYFERDAQDPDDNETSIFLSKLRILNDQSRNACFIKCPRRCHRTTYDGALQGIDESYDYFYGQKEEKIVRQQNLTFTAFHILHDVMRQGGVITFNEVGSYSFVELASNVGGTLGLFLGGALMTFAQVILFLLGYCKDNCKSSAADRKSVQHS